MYNHQLDTFLMVAELGSFGRAAEALYISTPAVIQQINLLESRCGFALFTRSNHGVRLTAAGQSLAEDARTIIRLSGDALARAESLAEQSASTVRVGTALLFKCRMLPDLWTRILEREPRLKLELVPMEEAGRGGLFARLGQSVDLWEGIYADLAWSDQCRFLELARTGISCAVARSHPLSGRKSLSLSDLDGWTLVVSMAGISSQLEALRTQIRAEAPGVQFREFRRYGLDTFTLCEMAPYVLLTHPIYADLHPNLVTIPLETDITLPYGLIYAKDPSPATERFLACAKSLRNEEGPA